MFHPDTLSGLAYRFRLIVDGLRKTVPEHQVKNPASCPLIGVIWTSLGRRLERFGRILARVAAGMPDPVWPLRAGRSVARCGEPDAGVDGEGVARKPRMPTRAGWLMVMMPWKVAPYGSQLRHWLSDPDVEALVRSSRQMRRLLRPLLRSLSTDPLPACLLEPAAEGAGAASGEPAPEAGQDAAPDAGQETGDEAAPDAGNTVAARAARSRASPRGATRARRATEMRAVSPDAMGAASTPVAAPAPASAVAASPPVEWWRVQDERRRAALAIARGSVCRA